MTRVTAIARKQSGLEKRRAGTLAPAGDTRATVAGEKSRCAGFGALHSFLTARGRKVPVVRQSGARGTRWNPAGCKKRFDFG